MSGWIKLHRSLIDWEWYDDINATRLLIHLLVSVNYEDKKWKGIDIKAGSMIFSWSTLSDSIGLSVKQCRVAMKKLEKSKEVARKTTNKYQFLTLLKWDKLQSNEINVAINRAGKGQAKGRQRATTKEYKEIKEDKKYLLTDFLKDWNETRSTVTRMPSHLNRIGSSEQMEQFNELSNSYKQEDFINAMKGLFKQEKFPKGMSAMQSTPKHFLGHFELYLTAYHDKNKNVWGE